VKLPIRADLINDLVAALAKKLSNASVVCKQVVTPPPAAEHKQPVDHWF
jgi:hypothetical protein